MEVIKKSKYILLVLIIVGISLFEVYGLKLYFVTTDSMSPYIKSKDLIVVKSESKYMRGDVITYVYQKIPGYLVTHRIVEVKNYAERSLFYTKGDENITRDPLPIAEHEIIGKVVFRIPKISYIFNPFVFGILFYVPMGVFFGISIYNAMLVLKHDTNAARRLS